MNLDTDISAQISQLNQETKTDIAPTTAEVASENYLNVADKKELEGNKKMAFDTIPITLKIMINKACKSGAEKYGIWNWKDNADNSMSLNVYLNALERHLLLFRAGQDFTSDTAIHHLDAVLAGAAILREAMLFGKVKDDRIKLSPDQIAILEESLIEN